MIIEGKFVLRVPIEEAWKCLLMPGMLGACLPGAEKVEAIDEKTYDCIVAAKVGSISVRFRFITTLAEIDPPTHLKAVGRGEELNRAGYLSHETVVDLKEISREETEVSYRSDVTIAGRLATFGDRAMRAKAKEFEGEFTEALRKKLSGDEGVAPELKVSIWRMLGTFLPGHSVRKDKEGKRYDSKVS